VDPVPATAGELGYAGGKSIFDDYVREVRPWLELEMDITRSPLGGLRPSKIATAAARTSRPSSPLPAVSAARSSGQATSMRPERLQDFEAGVIRMLGDLRACANANAWSAPRPSPTGMQRFRVAATGALGWPAPEGTEGRGELWMAGSLGASWRDRGE
jgi:hypothetical protein